MTTPVSLKSMSDSRPDTISGMAISLAFWICLILSAVLFAIVALSPKFLVYLVLRNQFDHNQLRLVSLERQAGQLQRVIDAIRSDKDFAAEMTRVEFDAVQPGEEVIPVDVGLKLDARTFQSKTSTRTIAAKWYEPAVRWTANDGSLRTALLTTAALLIVVSFTMLQPAGVQQVSSGVRSCNLIWQSLRNRYVR